MRAERQHGFLTALIERIDVGAKRIDIHLRPTRLGMRLDPAAGLGGLNWYRSRTSSTFEGELQVEVLDIAGASGERP